MVYFVEEALCIDCRFLISTIEIAWLVAIDVHILLLDAESCGSTSHGMICVGDTCQSIM